MKGKKLKWSTDRKLWKQRRRSQFSLCSESAQLFNVVAQKLKNEIKTVAVNHLMSAYIKSINIIIIETITLNVVVVVHLRSRFWQLSPRIAFKLFKRLFKVLQTYIEPTWTEAKRTGPDLTGTRPGAAL